MCLLLFELAVPHETETLLLCEPLLFKRSPSSPDRLNWIKEHNLMQFSLRPKRHKRKERKT